MSAVSRCQLPFTELCVLFLCAAALTGTAQAERLPLRSYTTVDGLPHNGIYKIVRDSRGFLWFCTKEGLSRFDGYQFTTYGTDQGAATDPLTAPARGRTAAGFRRRTYLQHRNSDSRLGSVHACLSAAQVRQMLRSWV